jgi:hypothetical protein
MTQDILFFIILLVCYYVSDYIYNSFFKKEDFKNLIKRIDKLNIELIEDNEKIKDLQNRHDELARQIFFIMWHSITGESEKRVGHLYEEHLKNKKEKNNNE